MEREDLDIQIKDKAMKKRPNYDLEIDVPAGMNFLYGYDVVNGTKSDFVEENEFYTDAKLKERRRELNKEHEPHLVNFYIKSPKQ